MIRFDTRRITAQTMSITDVVTSGEAQMAACTEMLTQAVTTIDRHLWNDQALLLIRT